MYLFTLLIQFIFAFFLFLILNYFDKKESKNNNVNHIIIPSVYIIILAGLFTSLNFKSLNTNIFIIVIFELIIRLLYVKSVLKRDVLVNNKYYCTIYIFAILFAYIIDNNIISKVDSVIPSVESILPGLWLLIIIFIYSLLKDKLTIDFIENKRKLTDKLGEYIVVSYARLKNRYNIYVNTKNKDISNIIYSIMVYENYKNPYFFRKLDNLLVKYGTEATELGIMQIKTTKVITDEESIKLALTKINKLYEKEVANKMSIQNLKNILKKYKNDDTFIEEISDIYDKIKLFEGE